MKFINTPLLTDDLQNPLVTEDLQSLEHRRRVREGFNKKWSIEISRIQTQHQNGSKFAFVDCENSNIKNVSQ